MDGPPVVRRNEPLVEGGETFALLVETRHGGGDTVARTAVHRRDFSRRVGGARFVARPDGAGERYGLAEVARLAAGMTHKAIAALIPADGQKSVIVTTPAVLADEARRIAILAEHVRAVAEVDPGVIFGPDMNVPEAVMNGVSEADGLLDHVSGLSRSHGGLSIDLHGYTAEGLVEAVRACYPPAALREMTATVQGFGAVGAHAARLLHRDGVRVAAVSNALGTLVAHEGELDVDAVFAAWQAEGDAGVREYARPRIHQVDWLENPDALFAIPCDLFIPAARTQVLALPDELESIRRTENPHVRSVVDFADRTGVRMVAQGANGPLSEAAERYLEERGVLVLPDYLVNCGGVIGGWVEWEARHERGGRPSPAEMEEIDVHARRRVRETVRRNVRELLTLRPTLRELSARLVERERQKLLLSGIRIAG